MVTGVQTCALPIFSEDGVLDFAGGTVVHINAGVAGLVTCLFLGKRVGYGTENMAPHNLVLSLIGASLLWVGWFGFNVGSALGASAGAGMVMVTTQVATAAAALSWMFIEWIVHKRPSVLGIILCVFLLQLFQVFSFYRLHIGCGQRPEKI